MWGEVPSLRIDSENMFFETIPYGWLVGQILHFPEGVNTHMNPYWYWVGNICPPPASKWYKKCWAE